MQWYSNCHDNALETLPLFESQILQSSNLYFYYKVDISGKYEILNFIIFSG